MTNFKLSLIQCYSRVHDHICKQGPEQSLHCYLQSGNYNSCPEALQPMNANTTNLSIKMKFSFVMSMGQRKSPWPTRYQLGALTTELRETLGELGHLLSSYVTHVLRAAEDLQCRKHHMCNKKLRWQMLSSVNKYSPSLTFTI